MNSLLGILILIIIIQWLVIFNDYKHRKYVFNSNLLEKSQLNRKFQILNYMMKYEYSVETIDNYLLRLGVSTVAIYGVSDIGNRIIEKLENSNIEVIYGIDNGFGSDWTGNRKIYNDNEAWPEVDGIIITVYDENDIIKEFITDKMSTQVIKIEEMVFWI